MTTAPEPATTSAATSISDRDIQSAILGRLTRGPAHDDTDIGVLVDRGVVTLCGVVDTIAQRRAAVHAANGVPGVAVVLDELLVHLSPTVLDAATASIVARALWDDPAVPTAGISVAVKDGTVLLTGTVTTSLQRAAARRVVEHLRDVREVDCRIRLVRPLTGDAPHRVPSAGRAALPLR